MAEAQKLVAHAAGSAENIQAAKMTAEGVIKALYAEVGWQVAVEWAKEFSPAARSNESPQPTRTRPCPTNASAAVPAVAP